MLTLKPGALVAALLVATSVTAAAAQRPNVLFILCDDLGFGDTGPTFQNQRAKDPRQPAFATPQLDRFAAEGLILRNHYCGAPVCAPSRASLLSGLTQGHANVRNNQFDKALADNHTLGTVLRAGGYATAAIGKWGLQGRADGRPNPSDESATETKGGSAQTWPAYPTKRGFDYYFGYVRHRDGHFHYPKEDKIEVWENEREVSADLDLCYTTDLFAARAKKWIGDHVQAHPGQPFFLYLAMDTPHAKLQLPPCPYPDGGGLRGGLQWLGRPGHMITTATGKVDGWYDPAATEARWDDDRDPSTPEVAWPEVQQRYMTDVRRIDAAVGDLLQLLKDLEIDSQTLVVFSSDNGPSKESYLKESYDPNFFNGFGPFDGIKRDTLEGGIREPTLVRWPGHVPAGRVDVTPSGMWDWMATFAELAELPPPAASDGVSLVPTLTGQGHQRPSQIYIEYFQNQKTPSYPQFLAAHRGRLRRQMQVVRIDGFTGLRYDVQSANDPFEIYDVEHDPQQGRNLAGSSEFFDQLQRRLQARALQSRRPDPSAPRPYDAALMPAIESVALKAGTIRCDLFQGKWPWVPDFRTLTADRTLTVTQVDGSAFAPERSGGAAFTGFYRAPEDGDYTFFIESNGGVELFLHEARVIDNDFSPTAKEVSGTVRLAKGWHPLRLYYREGQAPHVLTVRHRTPQREKAAIASDLLAVAQ